MMNSEFRIFFSKMHMFDIIHQFITDHNRISSCNLSALMFINVHALLSLCNHAINTHINSRKGNYTKNAAILIM